MSLKKYLCLAINAICTLFIFFAVITSKSYMYGNTLKFVMIFFSVLMFFVCALLIKFNQTKSCKILFLINVIFSVAFTVYHVLSVNNLLFIFKSVSNFKNFILSTGNKGKFIYTFLQMAQVIFLPVPASIIALAGALIYGPFWGSVYCIIGVLLGSYIAFFLGRFLGFKLVVWIAGYDNAKKYANILNNSGKLFLGIAFLLPMFPDDILCLIAGITSMKFKYFFIITTLFRPIGAICMCYFGGGYIIPFSGWGIPVWIIIGILMAALVFLAYKYQSKIETWIVNKFKKKKENKRSNI